MKKWMIPAIPFAVSIILSLSTVGSNVFWQDSGFYLTAVRELSALYPPGYVLYLLLCKLWTVVFFFLDFTLAVHLFSSFCAAGAAATMAVAVGDMLRAKGNLLRNDEAQETERHADICGAVTGSLMAAGYTFWFSGIYAKGYSFFYFILALLLWRMIRAAESQRPRDFTIVSILIGLAWSAHPSATNAGLALAAFVIIHRRVLGWKGIAWRTGLAAAFALGPSLLIPILSARKSSLTFSPIRGIGDFINYLRGAQYTDRPGIWGFAPTRVRSLGIYLWEEMLGIGLLLITIGLVRLGQVNRKLLLGIVAWVIPYALVTILFKIEGQHDLWFIAAWMPLYLVMGIGLHSAVVAARKFGCVAAPALGVIGLTWAVLLNRPLLDQRTYPLAEDYGRILLSNLDRDAILGIASDDSCAICSYLQSVRHYRTDVLILRVQLLGPCTQDSLGWYDRRILQGDPRLTAPDYLGVHRRFPGASALEISSAAFANANATSGRAIFFQFTPNSDMLRDDYSFVPAGPLWKLVRKAEARTAPKYWNISVQAEYVQSQFRRARGQFLHGTRTGLEVKPEPYERRLLDLLLDARRLEASGIMETGTPEAYQIAAKKLESVLRLDAGEGRHPDAIFLLAQCYDALNRYDEAEEQYKRVLHVEIADEFRGMSLCRLGELSLRRSDPAEARQYWRRALSLATLSPALRRRLQAKLAELRD